VVERLKATADGTQRALDVALEGQIEQRFWLVNALRVQADIELLETLAAREDVAHLHANPLVRAALPDPQPGPMFGTPAAGAWGLSKVQAPWVWEQGFTGQGVVIAGADTGYKWDHPALIHAYRGNTPSGVSHAYHWHSSWASTSGPCLGTLSAPCDDNTHGSHTMGTMVGLDGDTAYGMAPDAQWIGCRNMNNGFGTPASYIECFEFFLAPTDLDGLNPRPDLAPHITSNSWGCPPSEGCTDPSVLRLAVSNTRAAGIVQIMAAGNSGSACGSVVDPPAIYPEAFTIGNTTTTDGIAFTSSRGPAVLDGQNVLKPNVSAPGSGIQSANRSGTYSTLSGTSMAAPHVAGLAALLMSADPTLKGQPARVESIIKRSALPLLTGSQSCGGISGGLSPNHTFGHGRIDARAALLETVRIFTDGFGI
jgi:serine protease AprX